MRSVASSSCREAGFTLVELSVALAIAVFLLAGLFTIEQSTRKTSAQQTELAQLQDNERLAMTIMTDVIQAAGFFADPTKNTLAASLPSVSATFFPSTGEGVFGTTAAGQDSIYVQYMSEGKATDNTVLCNGQSTPNTAPTPATYINQFSINAPPLSQLVCTVQTNKAGTVAQLFAPVVLVEGVQKLKVLYGVVTNPAGGNNVDTYMTATQVNAAAIANPWLSISSVKIQLTFTNPLCTAAGVCPPGQLPTVLFERVIGIMDKAGA
jgi:type IV pilus assembly protein PilW